MLQQIVTPRAGEELAALKCALKGRDVLASLSARLPLQIEDLSSDQLDECKALIDSAAARDGELYLYALLTVMNRVTAPWQLIRLSVKAAGSDTAAQTTAWQSTSFLPSWNGWLRNCATICATGRA
jgi:hypothetical protein